MPVTITKITKGPNKGKVRVSTPGGVKAKATSMTNAKKQAKIINAAEAGHPFTGKKKTG